MLCYNKAMFKYTNLFQKKSEQPAGTAPAAAANPSPSPAPPPPRGAGFYPGAGQQAQQNKNPGQQQTPVPAPVKTGNGFNLKAYLLYALLIGLGIALAKAGFDYVMPMFMNKPAAAAKSPAKKSAAASLPIQLPFVPKPAAETAKPAAPKSAPLTSEGFTVSGIFIAEDPSESTAIINNQIVSPGATVDKAMVMEINMDGVVLEKDGQTIKISNR